MRVHSVITKYGSKGDGIIYAIQHEDSGDVYKDSLLQAGSKTYAGSYTVKAGDRIFFRLQSRYSGLADEVGWNPVITYDSIAGGIGSYLGRDLLTYDSRMDFMEGESSTAMAYKAGRFTVRAPYTKQQTTDDVLLKVVQVTKSDSLILKEELLKADSVVTDGEFACSLDLQENDSIAISFSIETQSPIDWQAVTWQPQCGYDDGGEKIQRIVPRRTMFNKPLSIVAPEAFSKEMSDGITVNIREAKVDTVVAKYSDGFYIVPEMSVMRADEENDTGVATVNILFNAEDGSLVYKTVSRLTGNHEMAKDTLFVADGKLAERLSSGKYSVTYTLANELSAIRDSATLAIYRDSICYRVGSSGVEVSEVRKSLLCRVRASVFSGFNIADLGLLYRGWGQFAYNGNREYADQPIDTSVLAIDTEEYRRLADDVAAKVDADALKQRLTPVGRQRFHVMGYDSSRKAYIGVADRVFISPDTVCSSRLGEAEIQVDTIEYANGEGMLAAPVLLTASSSNGYGVFGGVSFANVGGSVSGSMSEQTSYTKVSAMDLNGDGYPDWISDRDDRVFVHLTKPAGTLGDEHVSTSVPLPQSKSDAWTIDAGASLVKEMSAEQQAKADKASEAIAININPKFSSSKQGQNATNGNKTSAASVCASGNFSSGRNNTPAYWSDFNGDGLPDMVTGSGIRYNLGHGFTDACQNHADATEKSHYDTWGAGLGTSISVLGPAKITFGVNGTRTTSHSDVMFLDVNGDGLPDRLSRDDGGNLSVEINTGTDFSGGWSSGNGEMGKTRATSASLYGDFSVKIPIHVLFLKFTLTPIVKHSESSGVSTVHSSLQDIDGDGLPDLLYSDGDDKIKVRRNLTGRTNMLRSVTLPFGGKINIDYGQTLRATTTRDASG